MMSFLDALKDMFGGAKDTVESANVEELKQKIGDAANGTLDQAQNLAEQTPTSIDDNLVQGAQDVKAKVDEFTGGQSNGPQQQ